MSEIQDYMDWAGIAYEKSGSWIWPVDRDSMRVNLNKDYFNRFSTGVWGHLPEFIAEHDDLTPTEAKKRLTEFQQANPQSRRANRPAVVELQPFDLSALHAEKQLSTKCRDYLVKTRKIPGKLVDQLVKQGQIMEDTQHHNLVFPWYQGDKIVGADLQGTTYMKDAHQGRHYFKGIARHSAHDFGWTQVVGEGTPTRAVICEAPIDAMSYSQLFNDQEPTLIVSLGGVEKTGVFSNMIAERIYAPGGQLKELVLATDNDDAGRRFIQQFKDAGIQGNNGQVKVNVAIPHEKDWNDDLKAEQTVQQLISLDHFSNSVSETKTQGKQVEKASTPAGIPKPAAENNLKESYTEKRQKEIDQYSKQVLAAARQATRTPENLLEMADFMARFPQYSFHNQVLIKGQKAGALAVAGFTRFKQLGAKVQKGQHGIKIFAPKMVKQIQLKDKQWIPLSQATKEQQQAARKHQVLTKETMAGYRLVTVFDVTQTNLKDADYPKIYPNKPYDFPSKSEDIADLTQAVDEFAEKQGLTIEERPELATKSVAKGYYEPGKKTIVIQSDLPASEKLKVRFHEMGHALLGHEVGKVSRPIAELQAELTSAVVMKHCGINVEREAVPYISAWTDHLQRLNERQFGQQMTVINAVNRTSRKIIESIDPRYRELKNLRAQTIARKSTIIKKTELGPVSTSFQRQRSLSR